MKFDRKLFFGNYKKEFGGATQIQVDGLNRLLWGFETYYGWWDFLPQIANALAQIKHETAHSFHPVVEGYYLAKGVPADERYFEGAYAVVRNFQKQLIYYPYFGMGDIQLTHRENYDEQDDYIRRYFPEIVAEYNANHSVQFNLKAHPEQALDGKISFCIMTIGMHKGTFREGHHLDRYINRNVIDDFSARNIVNGDRFYKNKQGMRIGDVIAADAAKFRRILGASQIKTDVSITEAGSAITRFIESEPAASPTLTPSLNPADLSTNISAMQIPADSNMPPVQTEVSVKQEVETENGTTSLEVKAESPVGDAADAPPKSFIKLQDWKPFVVAKLKSVWKWFGAANIAQFPALSSIGGFFGGVDYWWIGVAAAILVFLFIFFAALLVSVVLLLILFWNRIEQFLGRMFSHFSVMNPRTFNLGVEVEKKF